MPRGGSRPGPPGGPSPGCGGPPLRPWRQGHRVGRLGHRRGLVQHAGDLLQRGGGGLERVVELGQVLQRVEEPAQVQQERGQYPDLDVAVDHPQPAVAQHDPGSDVADQGDPRCVHRQDPGRTKAGRRVVPVEAAEDLLVALFPAERLDRADTAESLHEVDDDLGDRFPGLPVGDRGLAPEPHRQPGQRDEPGQHHQRERPVQQQHPGSHQDQRERRGDQGVQAVVEQVGDGIDVRHLPGDDPP